MDIIEEIKEKFCGILCTCNNLRMKCDERTEEKRLVARVEEFGQVGEKNSSKTERCSLPCMCIHHSSTLSQMANRC